jgi:hypothetical protein
VVERITFLLRIREDPGSNLSPETGYPDRDFVVFSVSPDECRFLSNSDFVASNERMIGE